MHVPCLDKSGRSVSEKIFIPITNTFEEVLAKLHTTIGCKNVNPKHLPYIRLHCSKDIKKINLSFMEECHWGNLKGEWELEVNKKKTDALIEVLLDEDVSSW